MFWKFRVKKYRQKKNTPLDFVRGSLIMTGNNKHLLHEITVYIFHSLLFECLDCFFCVKTLRLFLRVNI